MGKPSMPLQIRSWSEDCGDPSVRRLMAWNYYITPKGRQLRNFSMTAIIPKFAGDLPSTVWSPCFGHVRLSGLSLPLPFRLYNTEQLCLCRVWVGIYEHVLLFKMRKAKWKRRTKQSKEQSSLLWDFLLNGCSQSHPSALQSKKELINNKNNKSKAHKFPAPSTRCWGREGKEGSDSPMLRGVNKSWDPCEWRLENFKGRGWISEKRASRAVPEQKERDNCMQCACNCQGRKKAATLCLWRAKALEDLSR